MTFFKKQNGNANKWLENSNSVERYTMKKQQQQKTKTKPFSPLPVS